MHTKHSIWILLWLIGFLFSCSESDMGIFNNTGRGGSLARFAISGNYLYVVTTSAISVYNIAENNFTLLNTVQSNIGLQTIQVRAPYLYLGASDAMYIYSIANPELPEFIFRYSHIVSCDPVVVQGNRAYVTLKSDPNSNACNRGVNTLEIIDITNPNNPALIASLGMTAPGGLAIDGDCLFVCEGEHGLTMFDVTNDVITPVKKLTTLHAYDVIAYNQKLTLTGDDGVFQYGYDCGTATLNLISKIPVERDAP